MAKKLSEIKQIIENSSDSFELYFRQLIGVELFEIIQQIAGITNAYIFSGIIRNFFLDINEARDIDIVLQDEIDINYYFKNSEVKKNNFGGYKIFLDNMKIDLWYSENTWAYKYQKNFDFAYDFNIPETAFFNFSSISYNINEHKFNYTKHFLRFLRDKELDVVFKPNMNYELCIINSIYYSQKYNLKLSSSLKMYLKYLLMQSNKEFSLIQKTHFGKILFDNEYIVSYIENLTTDRRKTSNYGDDQFEFNFEKMDKDNNDLN
jgi:transposase